MEYPLLEYPLSLCHVDGTENKTDKSKLMTLIEGITHGPDPQVIDITLVDAIL